MAGNLKGLGGAKGLLLRHGEKAAIGIVALVALYVIYTTMSLPRLDEKLKADKLHQAISETKAAVERQAWPDPTSEQASEVMPAKPLGEKADAPIDVAGYKWEGLPDHSPVAATVLRTDPKLLQAQSVRASGGSGLLAFLDEAIRKQQERARAAEEAERAKKEADRQAKEQKESAENPGGGAARGRNNPRGGPEGGLTEPFDKEHPKRRAVQNMARALGIPLQGGERIEKAYWAIVTAKVPIREQMKLYEDAFREAKGGYDPQRDFPQYKGYIVQRVEVLPGKEIQEADWKVVPVFDGQHASLAKKPISDRGVGEPVMTQLYTLASQFWAGMSPDVIDSRFSDYILTFPLPPLVGRDWGPEAKHPDFPTLAETPPLEMEQPVVPGATPGQAPGATPANPDAGSPFASANPAAGVGGPGGYPQPGMMRGGPGGGGYPRMGMGERMGPGPEGGRGGMFRGAGPEGGMMARGPMGEGGRGGMAGPMGGGPGQARTSLPKGVDFLMLRFVDFTVEPGKKYRYRVSLVLSDANYLMPENVLAAEVLDRRRQEAQAAKARGGVRADIRRVEGWSDPSPVVGIPLSGGAKLVDVKAPTADKVGDEPSVTLLVDSFDSDQKGNAIQAAKKHDFRRGNIANMTEEAEYLGEGGLWIDTHDNFHFVTGMTVLDIDGGKKLGRDMTSPGRVLLMGPAGDFYIRNELDDKEAVEFHRMLFEVDKRKNPNGPEGGGPLGPGGPAGRRPPGR